MLLRFNLRSGQMPLRSFPLECSSFLRYYSLLSKYTSWVFINGNSMQSVKLFEMIADKVSSLFCMIAPPPCPFRTFQLFTHLQLIKTNVSWLDLRGTQKSLEHQSRKSPTSDVYFPR